MLIKVTDTSGAMRLLTISSNWQNKT